VEQAVRDYYSLIQQEQYAVAWEMSEEYNSGRGISFNTYVSEWKKSGPATIVELTKTEESSDWTLIELRLYYPKKDVYSRIRYELVRDTRNGDERFGYWLFKSGKFVH
jgi:hypothetical protein